MAGRRPVERCERNVGRRSLAIMTRPEIARLLKRARRLQDIGGEGEEVPQYQRKNDVSFEQEGAAVELLELPALNKLKNPPVEHK